MLSTEKLEKRAVLWNRLALFVPFFFISFCGLFYYLNIMKLDTLFFITLISWVIVSITWWIWTMFSIVFLARMIGKTTDQLDEIKSEVKLMRKEIN